MNKNLVGKTVKPVSTSLLARIVGINQQCTITAADNPVYLCIADSKGNLVVAFYFELRYMNNMRVRSPKRPTKDVAV